MLETKTKPPRPREKSAGKPKLTLHEQYPTMYDKHDNLVDYGMRRSILELFTWIARPTLVAVVAIIIVGLVTLVLAEEANPLLFSGVALLTLAIYSWFFARGWWVWRNRTITAKVKSGQVTIVEKGPWILGLTTSSDDTINLKKVDINTVDRTFWQRKWLFDCDNMESAKGQSIRNVREFEHLQRIQEHVRDFEKDALDIARETLEAIKSIGQGPNGSGHDNSRLEAIEENLGTIARGFVEMNQKLDALLTSTSGNERKKPDSKLLDDDRSVKPSPDDDTQEITIGDVD